MISKTAAGPRLPRIRKRTDRSYELAAKGQQRDPSWTLVHGTLKRGIEHAWLEKDGSVYDPVADFFMASDQYVAALQAVAERRYSALEATEEMSSRKVKTWGPWHTTKGALRKRR